MQSEHLFSSSSVISSILLSCGISVGHAKCSLLTWERIFWWKHLATPRSPKGFVALLVLPKDEDLHLPITLIPKSPFPRWFNAEIRHFMNKSRTVRRRLKLSPTNHLLLKLQTLESSLRSLVQASSKLNYEQSLISTFSSCPGKLYRHHKSLSNPKSTSYPIIHKSKTVINPLFKARLFNSYF